MKRKTTGDDDLTETVGMMIVAWGPIRTERDAAAGIARKAAETGSAWIRIEAAKFFLCLGKDYRQDEIKCLRTAARIKEENACSSMIF